MMFLPVISSILFLLLRASNHPPDTTKGLILRASQNRNAATAAALEKTPTTPAQELLLSVCEHFQSKGLSEKSDKIEELIEELVEQKVIFDPATCLNGPLYAVQYIDLGPGKTNPSWVKYTTKGSIAGQLYELKNLDSIENLRVVNYAEIFEGVVKIKSEGGCVLAPNAEPVLMEEDNNNLQSLPNPFAQLFGGQTKRNNKQSSWIEAVAMPSGLHCPSRFETRVECVTVWSRIVSI